MVLVDVMSMSAFTDNMTILKGRNFEIKGFLDAFGKFRKPTFSFVMSVQPSGCLSVCLSVYRHRTTRPHLDELT
jgi:hypothetical protein